MTVSAQTIPTPYTGDGVTVAFPTVFTFYNSSEIQVVERVIATGVETIKTITTHYTVTGGSGSTGTVTAVTAPAATVEWHLYRLSPFTQTADYVSGDPFSAVTHEAALDKIVLRQQEMQEAINRSLKFPKADPTALDATLPPDIDRASQYLGFDADGEPTLIASAVSTTGVSAFGLTLLDDANAAAARTTLDVFEDVFTTRGDLLRGGVSGAEERVALGSNKQVLQSNATDAVWATMAAGDVSFSGSGSGYASVNVQTAFDERFSSRILTKKTSDEADAGSETVVALLTNITIPGTPNGSRKYQAMGQLLLSGGNAAAFQCLARVRVGTAGDVTDAIVWEASYRWDTAKQIELTIPIIIPEFTPAASTKLSVTFAGNDLTIRGDATVLESYIDISLI